MRHAVRALHSCVLRRLQGQVQLDLPLKASATPATRWCRKMFSDEAHATHLDRGEVVARVLDVVKTHPKADPTKTYARILGPADLIARLSSPKELSVIKGSQPTRKGCAFLKYDTKEQAMCAIEALNGVYRMEGSPSALVVKWADTEKERQALGTLSHWVKVKDRAVIITIPDETRVASPSSLQEAIDTEVGKYKGGRAFVRPSGTEDVVRVYVEASSQQSADALAQAVCVLVYHLARGVGPEP